MERINSVLNYADSHGIYPDLPIIDGGATPEVVINGKKTIMFASNNYLGLATHPRVKAAAIAAIEKYGVGAGGSRLLSGNIRVHRDFEEAIAKFKGGEDAIVWPCGYSANLGTVSALMDPLKVGALDFLKSGGVIISDKLNHASIIDGCKMSRQKVAVYEHCDMADLESQLKKYKRHRKLVVTDSVFSMDGDIAPLDKIVELCKKYNAMMMIDEAHASGVLGKSGHGSLEHFGLKAGKDVDIVLGTCSKALAASGGFVVASKEIVRYLRIASRPYMFSTAMMPASSAALIEVLNVIETEPHLREQLQKNTERLKEGFKRAGFDTCGSQTQIVPIVIGPDDIAIQFSRKLLEYGIYGPSVRWPAVEKGKSRIRFTVMATHTTEHIDQLVTTCENIRKEINF